MDSRPNVISLELEVLADSMRRHYKMLGFSFSDDVLWDIRQLQWIVRKEIAAYEG